MAYLFHDCVVIDQTASGNERDFGGVKRVLQMEGKEEEIEEMIEERRREGKGGGERLAIADPKDSSGNNDKKWWGLKKYRKHHHMEKGEDGKRAGPECRPPCWQYAASPFRPYRTKKIRKTHVFRVVAADSLTPLRKHHQVSLQLINEGKLVSKFHYWICARPRPERGRSTHHRPLASLI